MSHHSSSTVLISVLRNTSYLLEHYDDTSRDPTLSELQHLIGRAIVNIEHAGTAAEPLRSDFDRLEVE